MWPLLVANVVVLHPHVLTVLLTQTTPMLIKQIAEFAVSEMNKQENQKAKLVFEIMIEGQFQRVAGGNYKLVIAYNALFE
ncbi:hypothetical protein ACLB2K_042313 [Fragaria x ananassa]